MHVHVNNDCHLSRLIEQPRLDEERYLLHALGATISLQARCTAVCLAVYLNSRCKCQCTEEHAGVGGAKLL